MSSRSAPGLSQPSFSTDPKIRSRNQRVASYRDLVRPIALHYSALSPECPDDLIQVGLLGLIRAAELYLPSLGTPFSAFARHHIRGAILHYLRDQAGPIRVPRRQQELEDKLRQLLRCRQALGQSAPSEADIRIALNLDIAQWERFQRLRYLGKPVSLDLHAVDIASPEQAAVESSDQGEAMAVLEWLEPHHRAVVRKVVIEGQSLRRAATALNVSPMTVHRRLRFALGQLRSQLDGGAGALNSGLRPRPCSSAAPGC
jgi:RNA polymerase sigma-B factor